MKDGDGFGGVLVGLMSLRGAMAAFMLFCAGNTVLGIGIAALLPGAGIVRSVVAGHVFGLCILLCLVPWLHAQHVGRLRALQTYLLLIGVLLGCWLARYFSWVVLDLVILPDIPHHAAAVFGIVLATVGCAGLYYDGSIRLSSHRQIAEKAERLSVEARLRALQAQIEPGLFFTTLRRIDALICREPEQARALLGHLNRYLRASLAHARGVASLQTEIALLHAYLAVMNARKGTHVRLLVDCPVECEHLLFPPMLLQPLLQMALPESARDVEVMLSVRKDHDHLEVRMSDSAGRLAEALEHGGATLEEVLDRFGILFSGDATLIREFDPEGGAVVLMRIPDTYFPDHEQTQLSHR